MHSVYVKGYFEKNLGYDLFFKILINRYRNTKFYIYKCNRKQDDSEILKKQLLFTNRKKNCKEYWIYHTNWWIFIYGEIWYKLERKFRLSL